MKKFYYKFVKKYWSIISYEHAKKHNFIVQNGVFKNLKLNHEISWGKGDIASKIYGFYENKIQEKLKQPCAFCCNIVNYTKNHKSWRT